MIEELRGQVIKVDSELERYIVSNGSCYYLIPFDVVKEELKIDLIGGDSISFNANNNVISNITYISNVYLEDLRSINKTSRYVTAYVYSSNSGGYLASYKGYRVFIPFSECGDFSTTDVDSVIGNSYKMNIINVEHESVVASRKLFLDNAKLEARKREISKLKEGFEYIGTCSKIMDYGIFFKNKNSEGLLYFSSMIDGTQQVLSRQYINALLKSVFDKGDRVLVKVASIGDNRYSLDIDWNNEVNKEVKDKLVSYGVIV
jgi:ribosomal protein S1